MNGSGVCPPTTQSGSFSASPAPVQALTKPTKNSDPSNSHRSSPQNNPAELVEKPIQKTKEKVSPEISFTPQLEKKQHVECIICITHYTVKLILAVFSLNSEATEEASRHVCGEQQ